MVQLIAEHVARGHSFAFETTLADKSYARHVPEWQKAVRMTVPATTLHPKRVAVTPTER